MSRRGERLPSLARSWEHRKPFFLGIDPCNRTGLMLCYTGQVVVRAQPGCRIPLGAVKGIPVLPAATSQRGRLGRQAGGESIPYRVASQLLPASARGSSPRASSGAGFSLTPCPAIPSFSALHSLGSSKLATSHCFYWFLQQVLLMVRMMVSPECWRQNNQ